MSKVVGVGNLETHGGQRMYFDIMYDLLQTVGDCIVDHDRYEREDAHEVIVAVELLATLAEYYDFVLGIDEEQIQNCRALYIRLLAEAQDFDPAVDTSGWAYERYQVIQDVFDRAAAIHRKRKEQHS